MRSSDWCPSRDPGRLFRLFLVVDSPSAGPFGGCFMHVPSSQKAGKARVWCTPPASQSQYTEPGVLHIARRLRGDDFGVCFFAVALWAALLVFSLVGLKVKCSFVINFASGLANGPRQA